MKKGLFYILASFIIIGCTNSSRKESEKSVSNDTLSTNHNHRQLCFIDFVNTFSLDSLYQKNHTVFPLMVSLQGTDNDEEDTTLYVEENDWKRLSFENCVVDGIEYIHSIDSTNYVVTKKGVDTGINIEYHFINTCEQWKLIKIIDLSD